MPRYEAILAYMDESVYRFKFNARNYDEAIEIATNNDEIYKDIFDIEVEEVEEVSPPVRSIHDYERVVVGDGDAYERERPFD